MTEIAYKENRSSAQDIKDHFQSCDIGFISELSAKVDVRDYAEKLYTKAVRYEAWSSNRLVGLIAVYTNNNDFDFITDVSISSDFSRLGIASHLLKQCISNSKNSEIRLEVAKDNIAAQNLYRKYGFSVTSQDDKSCFLTLFTK